VLVTALKYEQGNVAQISADALGDVKSHYSVVVPALVDAIDDPRWPVKGSALNALGKIGPPAIDAVPALVKLLDDHQIQWRVANILRKIGSHSPEIEAKINSILKRKRRRIG